MSDRRLAGRGCSHALPGLALAAVAAAATVAASGAAVALSVARRLVTPPDLDRGPVRVLALDRERGRITLTRTVESQAPGQYTLNYAAGRGLARLGEVLDRSERTVTRAFDAETGASLDGVRQVWVTSAPERSLDDAGVPWREVAVGTELGPAPAWWFGRAGSDDWAIHVHGRGAVFTEPLRAVPLLHEAGWNSLVVSYRNDRGAPASPDGRFGLGATEWRDVDAAIRFALDHGASRILLVGWSMGGATVLQTLLRSAARRRIVGLVLESPVISWRATLRKQGAALRLPRWVVGLATRSLASPTASRIIGLAAPIPLDELEILDRAQELTVPILLFHSTGDTVVPVQPSAALARRRPDLIDYEQFDRALHVRLWNVDAARWEAAWRRWLQRFDTA